MMTKCRECGKEVSNQASTCPHCGVSKPCSSAYRKSSELPWKIIAGVLMVIPMIAAGASKIGIIPQWTDSFAYIMIGVGAVGLIIVFAKGLG